MCGIYGSTINYYDEVVKAKLNCTHHRGPDYMGFERTDDVILGHNRLAIIDLDSRSNQPFSYLHLKIVFNGEVYNYLDIKANLIKAGYKFSTNSDTEVICAAYLEYGDSCCSYFNGMFAFVIYDTFNKHFFGARDRFGKKPFYYAHQNGKFEFASQPSPIELTRNFTIDYAAINQYLIFGYIPEPRSIWNEVKKLPAGCKLNYNLSADVLKIEKYWDLNDNTNSFTGTYSDAKEQLKEILSDAVKIRLNADVPLGIFLSGGIDSSLVASLACKLNKSVNTFSVKFNEARFDESAYAKKVSEHLHTVHHEIRCEYAEGIRLIQNFDRYYDEPFADSSAIPTLLLSKYTKNHVTVALGGDGGDEGFIGYKRYDWVHKTRLLYKLPQQLRSKVAQLLNYSNNYKHHLIAKGISFDTIETLYARIIGGIENSWVLEPEIGLDCKEMHILRNPLKPLLERVSDFDIKTYMNGDINTKVDRAAMAFSLEVRAPLMDYRVIEFSRRLPTEFKFSRNGGQKRILKDILYENVPAQVFNRPKAGFTMPVEDWFRNELKEYVLDNLSDRSLKDIPGINVKRTSEIIKEHISGGYNRSSQIWKLLVLTQWLKRHRTVGADIHKDDLVIQPI